VVRVALERLVWLHAMVGVAGRVGVLGLVVDSKTDAAIS
jgi:hypothetical protein